MPSSYEKAYFLNDEDKAIMRVRAEHTHQYSGGKGHFKMKDIVMAAKDVKTWLHGWLQFCVITPLYGQSDLMFPKAHQAKIHEGFNNFLPIIIKSGLGYSTLGAQYLTIPGEPMISRYTT